MSELPRADGVPGVRPPRAVLPNCAFWRKGALLDVALRLRDPHDAGGVLVQLRLWLREGGMRLRRLIVNGRTELQEPPAGREAPASGRGARLNRHVLNRHV